MSTYSTYNARQTKQTEPIPGEAQVPNSAGGYAYELGKWGRLDRFLILGSDAPTYYANAQKLTKENAGVVLACLQEDGIRVVKTIVEISDAGRAPKNDPAIFALTLAASVKNGDSKGIGAHDIRRVALDNLSKVCRIPTHLFHFVEYLKNQRGFGRSVRTALGQWYTRWTPEQFAYEVVKYQQRDGWSNRDVFRKAHANLPATHQPVARWVVGQDTGPREVKRSKDGARVSRYAEVGPVGGLIAAFEEAKTADASRLLHLIRDHKLTREMVPTEALSSAAVWEALLPHMPLTALVRNLGKMTEIGLLRPTGPATNDVVLKLADGDYIRKSRLHPLAVLTAMKVYAQGHGEKGKLTWTPVRQIVDALDVAFYLAFGNVEPTGKRLNLALDVSGSMGASLIGSPLTCREACAALALVMANVEKDYVITGFTAGSGRTSHIGYGAAIQELAISPRQRLDDVVGYMSRLNFGGTDCALPMMWATEGQHDFDGFIILTDNETWAGNVHPSQALREYRRQRVPGAKLVVGGMTATGFSIADPADPGMLDVVGFDTATPQAIAAFLSA